jgi:hypothetical protein
MISYFGDEYIFLIRCNSMIVIILDFCVGVEMVMSVEKGILLPLILPHLYKIKILMISTRTDSKG